MDLNEIKDMGRWQMALVAAGVAFLVAAVAAKERQLVVAAIGVCAFGIGQLRNHPLQTRVVFDGMGNIVGKVTGHPRNPSVLGTALEVIGAALFLSGLAWYVLA